MTLPQDPAMLVSWLNMKMRDNGMDLEDLCYEINEDSAEILFRLKGSGFIYDSRERRFR